MSEGDEVSDDTKAGYDSEERGIINAGMTDDSVAKVKTAEKNTGFTVSLEMLPKSMVAKANNGNFDAREQLFQRWIDAPDKVRQSAILQIYMDGRYKSLFTAWEHSGDRLKAGLNTFGNPMGAVEKLFPTDALSKAAAGIMKQQKYVFDMLATASAKYREDVIVYLMRNAATTGGANKYDALLKGWTRYVKTEADIGFYGSTKAVNDLLPRKTIAKAADGSKTYQKILFGKWIAAPREIMDDAVRILFEIGKGKPKYGALNVVWLEYLIKKVRLTLNQ
ncbi:avirulence effector protein Avr3c [Phytophthora cinnamomi]|uniref:avirulence effector protein Avr3c n=1 Tax=Phytophthora cinnamomi TaxID=4785 RepID=UPI00355A4400|nr:avirulence effector protein Avr3c [Phytophthora cinnamomi]